jgi:hypothetical protein
VKPTILPSSGFQNLPVPKEVAACPVCGAPIVVEEVVEWECDGGRIVSLSIECTTQPDIDGDQWLDWHRGHWSMPYVDWLPVEVRVTRWLNRYYRVEVTP